MNDKINEIMEETIAQKNKLLFAIGAMEDVCNDGALRGQMREDAAERLDSALRLLYALEDSWADKLRALEASVTPNVDDLRAEADAELFADESRGRGIELQG